MEGVLKEIKNATFISIGQGIYHVVLSKPGEPVELLKDKDGYNFVFKYDTVAGIESTWAEGVVVGDILDYEKLDKEKSAAKEAEEKAKEAEEKAAEAKKKAERVEEAEAQIAESDAAFEAGEMNADVSEIIKNIEREEKKKNDRLIMSKSFTKEESDARSKKEADLYWK